MKIKLTKVLGHLAGILFFLTIPIVFSPERSLGPGSQRELFGYMLMVGFFYLNYHILIPRFYFKKKYTVFILIVLVCYLIITFFPQLIFQFPDRFEARPEQFSQQRFPQPPLPEPSGSSFFSAYLLRHFGHTVYLFFLVGFVSLAMRINSKWKETEKERINTELSFLKAQVNPHFLFNTLNSIYSLAIEKSDDTANAIVKLSEMMRYVLHDARQDFVSLQRELEVINDFIDLQRIRWGGSVEIQYKVTGDSLGKRIAPVILQPFIENAFKHGVSTEEASVIEILIQIQQDKLILQVVNDQMEPTHSHEEKSGLGIENTKMRLDLMYLSAYTLAISDGDKKFKVELTLHLNN